MKLKRQCQVCGKRVSLMNTRGVKRIICIQCIFGIVTAKQQNILFVSREVPL